MDAKWATCDAGHHWLTDDMDMALAHVALHGDAGFGRTLQDAPEGPTLEPVSMAEYRENVDDHPMWIAKPLVYAGGVTLVSGPPKKGKSTLLANLVRGRETGERFLDDQVWKGPTLLLTEEVGVSVVWKYGSLDVDVLDIGMAAQAGADWMDDLAAARDWVTSHLATDPDLPDHAPLVIIDTLSVWANVEDENSAGQMTAAVGVTKVLAGLGAGVILVHHSRKGGGSGGEAIRGSGAIYATVDVAAEMSVCSEGSDDRWLDLSGRVIFPERIRLAFDRDTQAYSVTDMRDVRREDLLAMVVGVPEDGDGWTRTDLRAYWGIRDTRDREKVLVEAGLLRSRFVESRPAAWRFWRVLPGGQRGSTDEA